MAVLDHLVVAAATLREGRAWVEDRLDVPLDEGGRHATFGTHNALLSLGPHCYLEVIAIDPDSPPPARPRWFELDTEAMRARVAVAPALVHWVARVTSVDEIEDPLELSRGTNRWVVGVPPDGRMPLGGLAPSRILWRTPPPSTLLPDKGIRLERLALSTPHPAVLRRALDSVAGPVSLATGPAARQQPPRHPAQHRRRPACRVAVPRARDRARAAGAWRRRHHDRPGRAGAP